MTKHSNSFRYRKHVSLSQKQFVSHLEVFYALPLTQLGNIVILGCSNFCIYSYSFTDDCCTLHQRLDRTTESSMSGHFDYVCTLLFHPSGQLFLVVQMTKP